MIKIEKKKHMCKSERYIWIAMLTLAKYNFESFLFLLKVLIKEPKRLTTQTVF